VALGIADPDVIGAVRPSPEKFGDIPCVIKGLNEADNIAPSILERFDGRDVPLGVDILHLFSGSDCPFRNIDADVTALPSTGSQSREKISFATPQAD
jgi:hypothetical protein